MKHFCLSECFVNTCISQRYCVFSSKKLGSPLNQLAVSAAHSQPQCRYRLTGPHGVYMASPLTRPLLGHSSNQLWVWEKLLIALIFVLCSQGKILDLSVNTRAFFGAVLIFCLGFLHLSCPTLPYSTPGGISAFALSSLWWTHHSTGILSSVRT